MDTELWFLVGAMVVFFAQWVVLLFAQNKITRLESTLRAIRWECQDALDLIGDLGVDDKPSLDRLKAIAEGGEL
jgi:hypothetical protein